MSRSSPALAFPVSTEPMVLSAVCELAALIEAGETISRIRLGGVAPCLGLAEGLETALSATALFGLPCWATLGTERFRLVSLPPQVTRLVLFLDNDRGGRRAEALAREAFAYLAVEVRYPRRRGTDWNDVLCAGSPPSPDRRSTGPARADSLNPSRRRG